MIRPAKTVMAWLAIFLGSGHIIYGLKVFSPPSAELIWFTGAGIAMICVATSNLGVSRNSRVTLIQNLIMTAYVAVMAIMIPLPQVLFGLGLFLGLSIISISWHSSLYMKNRA